MGIQKTNIAKSPLLTPVIQRDYTRGLNINEPVSNGSPGGNTSINEPIIQPPTPGNSEPRPMPGAGSSQRFNIPPADETKDFVFDDIPDAADINDDDHADALGITSASAKTFANFVGDAIQIYLPKLTFTYSKIDIESVIVNIQKGMLSLDWKDTFETINTRTEEALKISDDVIKMWKKAFKDFLEYKKVAVGPEAAFYGATAVLLADQGIKTYQLKKSNEEYMRQALQHCNPHLFIKKEPEKTDNTTKNGEDSKSTAA